MGPTGPPTTFPHARAWSGSALRCAARAGLEQPSELDGGPLARALGPLALARRGEDVGELARLLLLAKDEVGVGVPRLGHQGGREQLAPRPLRASVEPFSIDKLPHARRGSNGAV